MSETTDSGAAALRPWDEAALAALRYGWGDAYEIGHDDERGWWAARRDRIGALMTAPDHHALGAEIKADYGVKRVPRDLPSETTR